MRTEMYVPDVCVCVYYQSLPESHHHLPSGQVTTELDERRKVWTTHVHAKRLVSKS